jgi:hypothetical protein
MVGKVPISDGIRATQAALINLSPRNKTAFTNLGTTLRTLKIGHNEGVDRFVALEKRAADLEDKLESLPFL